MKPAVVGLVSSDGEEDVGEKTLNGLIPQSSNDKEQGDLEDAERTNVSDGVDGPADTQTSMPVLVDHVSSTDDSDDACQAAIATKNDHLRLPAVNNAVASTEGAATAMKVEASVAAVDILLKTDVRKRAKKMKLKNNPQPQPRSRLRKYQARRKPVKSSKKATKAYHLPTIQAPFLKGLRSFLT
ncbi:hypothetical protein PHYPSEUDO_013851 [Phytophthora pseudosyringae]|uniref:Uncharacterized protein n=1 Tax=Phytophthora pseudosyringae TaxID=221518 RepID=A0A8T1V9N9_9STRA|nr:hypothetical protein PHYPSEUDO_013851 [Phytophthora pseudosyringae]